MNKKEKEGNYTRRDFLTLIGISLGAYGAASILFGLAKSLAPSKDVLAVSKAEYDVTAIEAGHTKVVMWQGKPVFIRRRTQEQIAIERKVTMQELKDPEKDESRVKEGKDESLVTIGICTHLGCVPNSGAGEFKGWFCPCHGSHYDLSGRIRKGPAPKNLEIPPYDFFVENGKLKVRIG